MAMENPPFEDVFPVEYGDLYCHVSFRECNSSHDQHSPHDRGKHGKKPTNGRICPSWVVGKSDPNIFPKCAMVKSHVFLGMGNIPPLMTGILIMGPYKPLRNWVDDHPLLYGNNGS